MLKSTRRARQAIEVRRAALFPPLPEDIKYNVLVLGAPRAGKTKLIHRALYLEDAKLDNHGRLATYMIVAIVMDKAYDIVLKEAPGCADKWWGNDAMFKENDGFMVVFDLTDPKTFGEALGIVRQIERVRGKRMPIVYVGTKADSSERVIFEDLITEHIGKYTYVETAAAKDKGAEESFDVLFTSINEQSPVWKWKWRRFSIWWKNTAIGRMCLRYEH